MEMDTLHAIFTDLQTWNLFMWPKKTINNLILFNNELLIIV